ncbi:MAG: DUF1064 domain-containing protein [Alphaproteobacteria bacterium]|nr:DUF1064 domain-containing protein [Alphaproteobacteria bacterium]
MRSRTPRTFRSPFRPPPPTSAEARAKRKLELTADGITFDSPGELRRYGELKMLARAGRVRDLVVHPRLPLVINGRKIGRGWLTLDFSYQEWRDGAWRTVYEDYKEVDTRESKLRRQIAEAIHGITIRVKT